MPNYDFKTLSPIDFEALSRDLLQKTLKCRLETFAPGKDGGIDLRGDLEGGQIVVQCKHYVNTGFNRLMSQLKTQEKEKIEKLNPNRYILTTSVGLSPTQKKKISDLLAPYVRSESDIFSKEDLNALLGQFPEIEKGHFKLWLSSSTVLETMLQQAIVNESEDEMKEIVRKAKLYVFNPSFAKALEILETHGVCVISGMPGIGKTTLAQMVALQYKRSDWEVITISRDIGDANKVKSAARPQLFMYDDFLGSNKFTGFPEKGEDQRLDRFIRAIKDSKNTRLLLTTREYILAQARQAFERLKQPIFSDSQYVLDLAVYTRPVRAEILYNHLHFSKLDREVVRSAVTSGAYLEVIDHPNYNPRVIEYLTDPNRIGTVTAEDYPNLMRLTSKDPSMIWDHAFHNDLSSHARKIVLLLATLPLKVYPRDLKDVFVAYSRGRVEADDAEEVFSKVLNELEGSFILTSALGSKVVISFHNPSIRDFAVRETQRQPEFLGTVVRNAIYFEQLEFLMDEDQAAVLPIEVKETVCCKLIDLIESPSIWVTTSYTYDGLQNYMRLQRRLSDRIVWVLRKAKEHWWLAGVTKSIDTYLKNLRHLIDKELDVDEIAPLLGDLKSLNALPTEGRGEIFASAKNKIISESYLLEEIHAYLDVQEQFPEEFEFTDDADFYHRVLEIASDKGYWDDYNTLETELEFLKSISNTLGGYFDEDVELMAEQMRCIEEEGGAVREPRAKPNENRGNSICKTEDIARMFKTLLD